MSPIARTPLAALALCLAAAACREEPVVETQPRPLSKPAFQYPEELWDAGVEGRTVLAIHVDTAGRADSVRVETPAGDPAFDRAAVAGTNAIRFEPARRDGKPVARWVLLPVEFEITADTAAPADTSAQQAQTQ
jgi:periplasmic protein TonB